MTVVLTGATGYLGSHALARLLTRGHEVIVLVRGREHRTPMRLLGALRATGIPLPDEPLAQVTIVRADLDEPRLGLGEEQYRHIAHRMHTLWHLAGCITLTGDPDLLHRTNVDGTRGLLDLAAAAPHCRHVVHTGTAFVAGGRLHGTVYERDLDSSWSFLNAYERTKFDAERLVRTWSLTHDVPVSILRPSIVVGDRPLPAAAPRHPHAVIEAKAGLLDRLAQLPDTASSVRHVRVACRPGALLNLVPVEFAMDAMARIALREPTESLQVHHVVHPDDTRVTDILGALSMATPRLRLHPVSTLPRKTPLETQVHAGLDGYAAYFDLHRRYDQSTFDHAVGADLLRPAPLDPAYLTATFTSLRRDKQPVSGGATR
ncbi:SDR family oxidoreductase [Streptomyces sp. NPDC087300]|uniref:SDR family oxidoreductase n=1 Tax=Streptomyces sp. NPDC087300 TaxID=3365780 RepID=UPI0038153275